MKTPRASVSRSKTKFAVAVAALTLSATVGAVDEIESNSQIGSPQPLTIEPDGKGGKGSAMVKAAIGNLTGAPVGDLDFYSFFARAGDVVTIDIDGGWDGVRAVDTIVALFGQAPGYKILRQVDDLPSDSPLDEGSISRRDARIDQALIPTDGIYTVGVSSYPRRFKDGGGLLSTYLGNNSNGDYTLIVSGVSPPLLQINIDIKPGNGDSVAPINPKSKGKIPVALLSATDFNAMTVKQGTLRFGHTGNEASLAHCGGGEDVNGDGLLDLVCHFENQLAGFQSTDDEAIARGVTGDGRNFEGRGRLKVVPAKSLD